MNDTEIQKIFLILEEILIRCGSKYNFILGSIFNEDGKSISFPYHINFETDLLVEFIYNFLQEEDHSDIKEKLFRRFNMMDCKNDEMSDFVKFVKI